MTTENTRDDNAPERCAPAAGSAGVLWLNVECSPGCHVDDACRDAVMLADKLGLTVWFDFNGVKCGARPGDDWQLLVANWSAVLDSKSSHKVACANPQSAEVSHVSAAKNQST